MQKNMRGAFNLIMAIGMILILSGAAIMTLKYVSISAKHITDTYMQEQAEIFSQSVLEATILQIEGYKRSSLSDCIEQLEFDSNDKKFHADVKITHYYLYDGKDNDGVDTLPNCSSDIVSISTRESHGYVMIETIVTTNENNKRIKGYVTPIRIVTRSLQRP